MALSSTNGANGAASQTTSANGASAPATLQANVEQLRDLLANDAFSDLESADLEGIDLESLDEPRLEELLQKLEAAEGIASGMETRLDDIIGSLDGLLESLQDVDMRTDGVDDAHISEIAEGEEEAVSEESVDVVKAEGP